MPELLGCDADWANVAVHPAIIVSTGWHAIEASAVQDKVEVLAGTFCARTSSEALGTRAPISL